MKLSLSVQCLGGIALGILTAILLPSLWPVGVDSSLGVADTIVRLWTNALRLLVLPLVGAKLFATIAAQGGSKGEATRLGMLIPLVMLGLLVFTALVGLLVAAGLLTIPAFGNVTLDQPLAAISSLPAPGAAAAPRAGGWIDDLVPSNLFAALSADNILALLLFTLAFAIAARRLPSELRSPLVVTAQGVSDTLFVLIGWLLLPAPLVLFAFAFRLTTSSGWAIGRLLIAFTIIALIVIAVCTVALYPVAALLGRVPLARFARAMVPAQAIAVASHSSLATVPALLREAVATLGLPEKTSALVIPLSGGLLKLSRAASHSAKLLFLAHVLDFPLGLQQIVVFTAINILLSPATQGVPRVISGGRSMPAYLAIGMPPEYPLLLATTSALTDVLQTLLNSTAYMTSAVLVSRLAPATTPHEARAPEANLERL